MRSLKPFFITLFLPLCLSAQQHYAFQHLTVEDGLLSNPKVNVFQDAESFYWFSSVGGLQRFDGKNFITFRYDYGDKIVSGDIDGKPIEDSTKNIWVINQNGINIYERKKQLLSRLYMPDAADSNSNNVAAIVKDDKNSIWIFTQKNIFKYNYKNEKPLLWSKLITGNSGIVTAIFDRHKNGFWIYTINTKNEIEVVYFSCNTKQITHPFKQDFTHLFDHQNLVSLFNLDDDGNLWMANYLGDIYKCNTDNYTISYYPLLRNVTDKKNGSPNAAVHECFDDGNGSILFATDYYGGVLKYDKKTDKFSRLPNENGAEYGFHYDEEIYSFFKDSEGNLWIDTDLGMNVFNPGQQQFNYLDHNIDSSESKFSSDITSVFESSKKNIWISTWGDGVFEYDSNFILKKNFIHHKNDNASFGEPLNRAWNFAEDREGKIWIGCQGGMLSVFNPATGKFINNTIPAFNNSTVMQMQEDRKNNVWFALFNGTLAEFDADSGKIITCEKLKSLSPSDGLCVDEKDNVWVAGASGLYKFDAAKKAIVETVLSSQHIFSPVCLNDSEIIGGTAGKGLFIFNKVSKATRFFNTSNGLSSDIVYGGLPANARDIWVLASNGIERLNLLSNKISNYSISDGIRDHVFARAFCRLKNGIILMASNSGIIYFDPAAVKEKPAPPNIVITGFEAAQQSLSVDSLEQYKKIDLSWNQNLLTVNYASVSFSGRKTDTYFYKLNGVDLNWISGGTIRSVTYANLSAGTYVFEVKAQNSDGVETNRITQLTIVIHPPWWRTWWAYIVWFIIVAFIFYRIYINRKRSRSALSEVRQRIATDLHDDIGSTLNSISVYSEIAGRQLQSDPGNAKNLLEKMGDSSRNMIDNMNDIVWAVNPENDQFENILQRMQYFAGELLSGKNILLSFNADEKIKSIKLPMVKRKNFYLIFKEAVNNAYKYSNATSVNVEITLQLGFLVMKIKDNGSGFDLAKKSKGNGLKNMDVRAKEIAATLSMDSLENKGTEIQFSMLLK